LLTGFTLQRQATLRAHGGLGDLQALPERSQVSPQFLKFILKAKLIDDDPDEDASHKQRDQEKDNQARHAFSLSPSGALHRQQGSPHTGQMG
jgi:hypothetical protein